MQDVRKFTTPAEENLLEISGLKQEYRYEFWVTASTSVGEGKATKSVIQRPDGPLGNVHYQTINIPVLCYLMMQYQIVCSSASQNRCLQ